MCTAISEFCGEINMTFFVVHALIMETDNTMSGKELSCAIRISILINEDTGIAIVSDRLYGFIMVGLEM